MRTRGARVRGLTAWLQGEQDCSRRLSLHAFAQVDISRICEAGEAGGWRPQIMEEAFQAYDDISQVCVYVCIMCVYYVCACVPCVGLVEWVAGAGRAQAGQRLARRAAPTSVPQPTAHQLHMP